jgi:hypothetical protein
MGFTARLINLVLSDQYLVADNIQVSFQNDEFKGEGLRKWYY